MLDHEHVQQIEAKLKAMSKQGNKKVLLDLRDVAAGDMAEATRAANFFLPTGTIATLEGQKVQTVDVYGGSVQGDQRDGSGGGSGEPGNSGAGRAGGGGAERQQARRGGWGEDLWRRYAAEDV